MLVHNRDNLSYYLVETASYTDIQRLWDYVESTREHMLMYKTRLASSHVAWVIEMPKDRLESLFLLQFAHLVTSIARPNYYCY